LPNRTDAENAAINLAIAASDPDGDAITLSASGLPGGLSLVAGAITGTIDFTAAASSPYTVHVTATAGALSDTKTFLWTVTNTDRPPTITTTLPDRTDAENATINLAIAASDPDGDTITLSASGLPGGLSLVAGAITGTIDFTAAA